MPGRWTCSVVTVLLPIREGAVALEGDAGSSKEQMLPEGSSGPADGYRVEYVSEVRTYGAGRRLSVAGGAILRVHLEANVFDQLGHLHYARVAGDHVADVRGYQTLGDVVYGGCFEGRTTFGVGVRARLPFRVFGLAGPGSGSRIVLDVAHRW